MVSISILWAPFWFNPQTFQVGAGSGGINRCQESAEEAHNRMRCRGGGAEAHSHSPLVAAGASKRLAPAWAPGAWPWSAHALPFQPRTLPPNKPHVDRPPPHQQLERCKDDFEAWLLWMTDVTDTSTNSTW